MDASEVSEEFSLIEIDAEGPFSFFGTNFRLQIVSTLDSQSAVYRDDFFIILRQSEVRGMGAAKPNIALEYADGLEGPVDEYQAKGLSLDHMQYQLYVNRDQTELLLARTSYVLKPTEAGVTAASIGWMRRGRPLHPSLNVETKPFDPSPELILHARNHDWVLGDSFTLESRTQFSRIRISKNVIPTVTATLEFVATERELASALP